MDLSDLLHGQIEASLISAPAYLKTVHSVFLYGAECENPPTVFTRGNLAQRHFLASIVCGL